MPVITNVILVTHNGELYAVDSLHFPFNHNVALVWLVLLSPNPPKTIDVANVSVAGSGCIDTGYTSGLNYNRMGLVPTRFSSASCAVPVNFEGVSHLALRVQPGEVFVSVKVREETLNFSLFVLEPAPQAPPAFEFIEEAPRAPAFEFIEPAPRAPPAFEFVPSPGMEFFDFEALGDNTEFDLNF